MKDVDYRNHADPSISSGSSPGATRSASGSALATREIHAQDAKRPPFPAPHWRGEARPHGARRVRLQTRFPSLGFLTNLVRNLGYDGSAALAAMVQAHQPWL